MSNWRITMSLSTVLGSTTANNTLKSTATSYVKSLPDTNSTSSTNDASNKPQAFGDALAVANLSTIPSKTLSPDIVAATVSSTTLQTSNYVFDPLGVVGAVPESNTFLQAIRAMLGKPAETPAATATASASPAPAPTTETAATPLTTFGALPAATPPIAENTAPAPTTSDATTTAKPDLMNTIEAQLSYLTNTSDMVNQYIANASAAAVVNVQSTLNNSMLQDAQAA